MEREMSLDESAGNLIQIVQMGSADASFIPSGNFRIEASKKYRLVADHRSLSGTFPYGYIVLSDKGYDFIQRLSGLRTVRFFSSITETGHHGDAEVNRIQ